MPKTQTRGGQILDQSIKLDTPDQDVVGVLPAANGGTGLSSPGASGNVLTSNGSGGWQSAAPTGGSGTPPANMMTTDTAQSIAAAGAKTFAAGALLMTANGVTAEPYSDANPPFTLNISDQASTPANPPAGQATLYSPDGKTLRMKDADGTDTLVGPIAGGSGGFTVDDFRRKSFITQDFLQTAAATWYPFVGAAISTGTTAGGTSAQVVANHPGTILIRSSATANSGYNLHTGTSAMLLGGGEVFEAVAKTPAVITTITQRIGFFDQTLNVEPTDGVYIQSVGATLQGKTANANTRSTTATSYTLAANTYYRYRITVNSPTLATFEVFNEAGTRLWVDTLTANIPTVSANLTGAGLTVLSSGAVAIDLMILDYLGLYFGQVTALSR